MAVVRGVAHIPMIQVIVSGPQGRRVNSIHYIFERHRRYLGEVPQVDVPRQPDFVVVNEFVAVHLRFRRQFGRFCQARDVCFTWQFQMNLPGRNLALLVNSNLPPREVRRIGYALIRDAASGK